MTDQGALSGDEGVVVTRRTDLPMTPLQLEEEVAWSMEDNNNGEEDRSCWFSRRCVVGIGEEEKRVRKWK